jgi:hypothetical protein
MHDAVVNRVMHGMMHHDHAAGLRHRQGGQRQGGYSQSNRKERESL